MVATVAVAAAIPAAVALATAPIGTITRENLTAFPPGSLLGEEWKVNADRIKFRTKEPTTMVFQRVTYAPGADSGWHFHPGVVFVSVTQGQVTRWVRCQSHTYKAGESFLETGQQPEGRLVNTGTDEAKLVALFVVPQGSPLTDPSPPAPDCSKIRDDA